MRYFLLIVVAVGLFANEDIELVKLAYESGLKPVPKSPVKLSKHKVLLGEKLFFDKRLSLARDISCASCHSFDKGGADAKPTAIGHKNRENPFHLNTPTVLNTVYAKKFFWNGSSDSLQDQAKGPLQASFEMSITPELAEKRVYENREYEEMFQKAFGSAEVTFEKITDALATYEKTLVTRGRYDDFLLGYFDALNSEEKRGLELFIKKGCVGCHNGIALGGQVMRKFPLSYHSIWSMEKPHKIKALQKEYSTILESKTTTASLKQQLGEEKFTLLKEGFFTQIQEKRVEEVMSSSACKECHIDDKSKLDDTLHKRVGFPFENRGGFMGSKEAKKYFRVPLLRNVVQTAPYFHNGAVKKLEDAIKIMGRHQSRVNLSKEEIETLILFFKAVDTEIEEER